MIGLIKKAGLYLVLCAPRPLSFPRLFAKLCRRFQM